MLNKCIKEVFDVQNKNNRIIEIKNPVHDGFYETEIDPRHQEESYNDEVSELMDKMNLNLEYDYHDYVNIVTEGLNDYFIDLINEIKPFGIKDLFIKKESELLTSPREYNFETDKSYIKVEINRFKFNKFINLMFSKYYDELKDLILENHSSYDGFYSFYNNDIDVWKGHKYNLDYNELATIFQCLVNEYKSDEDLMWDRLEIADQSFMEIDHWYESYKDGSKFDYWEIGRAHV